MVAFRGHFDGRVIVPAEKVDLPTGELLVRVESVRPPGVPGRDLLRFAGTISDESADEMLKAMEDCRRIEDDW